MRYNFIDKRLLKKVLNDLVLDEYLYKEKYYTATIYKLNTIKIINTLDTHKHSNTLVNNILYMNRNIYQQTAVFYNVSICFIQIQAIIHNFKLSASLYNCFSYQLI